ncbi:hypothetical protein MMC31_005068 [Peltigera leucophlebia]|nr:hypothetical protein [Peltigera leucophlebia]
MNAPTTRDAYKKVSVLLTWWENDDEIKDVERDLSELQRVFETDYNYHCTRYCIPRQLSESTHQSALRQQMEDFALLGTSEDLLIFYYAGHGLRATEPGKKAVFELHSGKVDYSYQDKNDEAIYTRFKINFSTLMRDILERAPCPVLYLMDCCYSSAEAMESEKEVFVTKQYTQDLKPTSAPSCETFLNERHVQFFQCGQ